LFDERFNQSIYGLLTALSGPSINYSRFPVIAGHALPATTVVVAFKIVGLVSGLIDSGR
jgi:hypothetical protein